MIILIYHIPALVFSSYILTIVTAKDLATRQHRYNKVSWGKKHEQLYKQTDYKKSI